MRRRPIALQARTLLSRRTALFALLPALLGACREEGPPPTRASTQAVLPFEEGVLRIAGSGAMVPLARALGRALPAESGLRVVVEDSIGTGGGVRAVSSGAVDIGLVSRRLSEAEQKLGLSIVGVARDVVIIAAHPDVPVAGLGIDELCDLYIGASRSFSDGSGAVVLLRERGESANLALEEAVPCMRETLATIYRTGYVGHRVLYHDDVMAAALALTPGAIGVYSLPLLRASRMPLKMLAIDGRAPSVSAVADGSWKLSRPLSFVLRPERVARARRFLDFALSPEGRAIAEAGGYVPPTVASPTAASPTTATAAPTVTTP